MDGPSPPALTIHDIKCSRASSLRSDTTQRNLGVPQPASTGECEGDRRRFRLRRPQNVRLPCECSGFWNPGRKQVLIAVPDVGCERHKTNMESVEISMTDLMKQQMEYRYANQIPLGFK